MAPTSPTSTPTFTPTFTPTPTPIPSGPVTINYVYDPLYRLKEANYSNGDYYHYTYDAVGNRLTQQKSIIGLVTTDTYTYDDANRLSNMNAVNYAWDNNGNLLNDGVNTYTYDSANRLKQLTQGANTYTYSYNGLGDRLVQNGVHYTLDLNASLPQVLNDGTNTYLYGMGRIAQVNASTEYFLGDALGSVRQLTNAQSNVILAKSYAPYGETMASAGSGTSPFAYTGEQTDASGLTYLRARYYASGMGRFLTRDTWEGDVNRPISFNRWNYVQGNPINFTDPSGHDPWWCEEVSRTEQEKRDCINTWIDTEVQQSNENTDPRLWLSAYDQEDWNADHSIYLNRQMGPCTACHLGKGMDWREDGFIPSNNQVNAFRSNASSGAMALACMSHPYAMAGCAGLAAITDKNPITGKAFPSNEDKGMFIVLGSLPTVFRLAELSCSQPTFVGGINPSGLRGAGPNEIRQIVPANAIEGMAANGDPKWTWLDDLGNTWEIRYHPEANQFFMGKGPSGYGPSIKFGQQMAPGEGTIDIKLLRPIDAQFVQQFGTMGAPPHPQTGLYYVDQFGYVYYDDLGQLWPLITNQTHIPGANNPWPYVPPSIPQ